MRGVDLERYAEAPRKSEDGSVRAGRNGCEYFEEGDGRNGTSSDDRGK